MKTIGLIGGMTWLSIVEFALASEHAAFPNKVHA